MDKELQEKFEEILKRLELLETLVSARFEKLKEVIFSYLELSSSIALASVKTSLKNV